MIQGDSGLWRSKVQALNPAECSVLKDSSVAPLPPPPPPPPPPFSDYSTGLKQRMQGLGMTDSYLSSGARGGGTEGGGGGGVAVTDKDTMLDRIARQPGFMGWENVLVQELALKQNWRHGRYVYSMTVTLARNIKPTLLAWPFLFLIDDWPKLYRISLMAVRRDRYRVIPTGSDQYTRVMGLQGHGAMSCMAWDQHYLHGSAFEGVGHAGASGGRAEGEKTGDGEDREMSKPLPLALGGILRSVRVCDPETNVSVSLPDVHHGFPLHLCFLRDQVLSVTLDGQITFFHKGEDYRPIRSCTVATKVLQITPVDFGSRTFERELNGSLISWKEVICLGHEDGVIIKDEHSHTLCHLHLEIGSKLLQFQAIADEDTNGERNHHHHHPQTSNPDPDLNANSSSSNNSSSNSSNGGESSSKNNATTRTFYRNELLILFEDPNTRQRCVLRIRMEPGFVGESSRELITHGFLLGRGGDARDSMAMYRDRIGIMTHRHCSSDLGHYCVLRLLDLKEDVAISTEYAQHIDDDDDDEDEEDEEREREREREQEERQTVEREEGVPGSSSSGGGGGGADGGVKGSEYHEKALRMRMQRVQRKGRLIHLNDFAGHKAACRILAMDHARVVLGIGPRIVKILCLV
ncbi:hypothetical protein EDD21DRAFT_449103 [Dissophora ornata]|nr:hypothetical protein EDD21DRAFT_449103 [Dissophora ornata]